MRKERTAVLRRYARGRPSVAEGNSPKSDLYSPANRPNCQKPYCVAISVTVVAVGAASRSVRRARYIRRKSKSETDLEALWGNAGPCVGIERPKLQRALLPGVFNVRCRLGTSVTSLAQDGHRVSVRFSDGSTGDYDLVVGADGIGSTVRALALTTAAPSELGAMNWRSIASIRPAGLTGLQMHLGDGCTFGLVPMGGGRTYGFAYVIQPRFRDPLEGRLDRLRDRFAKFGSRVQEYLSSLERDDRASLPTCRLAPTSAEKPGRCRRVSTGDIERIFRQA
jgi:2-polyprenyl-6-methoxyphenol hydroxylase-like FAD-dependent oxidoreductase